MRNKPSYPNLIASGIHISIIDIPGEGRRVVVFNQIPVPHHDLSWELTNQQSI